MWEMHTNISTVLYICLVKYKKKIKDIYELSFLLHNRAIKEQRDDENDGRCHCSP